MAREKTNDSFFKIHSRGRERERESGTSRYSPARGGGADRLTSVQMLSFDPPVVFPHGAKCKHLFLQSAGRAVAFRVKKKKRERENRERRIIEPEANSE